MTFKKQNIIAEIGSVHDGSFGNACQLVEWAANHDVDTVKFQMHISEHESLDDAPSPSYFQGESRNAYFDRIAFTEWQWKDLAQLCEMLSVELLVSPFSTEAVNFLVRGLGVKALKVASGEVTNIPLLNRISCSTKPVYLSTGMNSWDEIDRAMKQLKNNDVMLMQCSSMYPCPLDQVGINVIDEMAERYQSERTRETAYGFSDHTKGSVAAIMAIAHGAQCVEKHITFSNHMYGSDAKHATELDDFARFVEDLRAAWEIQGSPVSKTTEKYADMKRIFEKKIVAKRDMKEGEIILATSLAYKKTSQDGIPASEYTTLYGRNLKFDISKDTVLSRDMLI